MSKLERHRRWAKKLHSEGGERLNKFREKSNTRSKEYYQRVKDKDPEKYEHLLQVQKVNYRKKTSEEYMIQGAKSRAKKHNLDFDITKEDIVVPSHCPILNIPIIKGEGKLHKNSPSLDRIDPNKGYLKGNIAVISHEANKLKSYMTVELLDRIINYIKDRS